jgi:hypothetical protein
MLETGLDDCGDGVDAGGVEVGVDVGVAVVQTCVVVSRMNLALSR